MLLYNGELSNSESVGKYLAILKKKYSNNELTLLACEEMGEEVDWALAKRNFEPPTEVSVVLPEKFALRDNYPNPFNPKTTLTFNLPEEARVEIIVYDLMGREVWKSAKTQYSPGTYSVIWNGVNHSGQPVVTGMYLVRLNSDKYTATQKVLLMK